MKIYLFGDVFLVPHRRKGLHGDQPVLDSSRRARMEFVNMQISCKQLIKSQLYINVNARTSLKDTQLLLNMEIIIYVYHCYLNIVQPRLNNVVCDIRQRHTNLPLTPSSQGACQYVTKGLKAINYART